MMMVLEIIFCGLGIIVGVELVIIFILAIKALMSEVE